jgi:pimeloyl-ACP methyl ester carboxylesterase
LPNQEREFELPTLKLAAKEWGQPGGVPVLALHGWLDNAATFDRLAPLLPGTHLVALDLAGHGFSANRSADSGYNIWQDIADLIEVAAALGWERFNLLGHSRGAAIAALFAGTFPDRVERVVLIEGGVPILDAAEAAPTNLADALEASRMLRTKTGRTFAAREVAIEERANGFSKVSTAAAEILATRSLREVPGGYRWHADQRLKAASEFHLTPEQAGAFFTRIEAPVLMFLAAESPFAHRESFTGMLSRFRTLELEHMPGRHHLHLEGGETEIAARIRPFLELPDA